MFAKRRADSTVSFNFTAPLQHARKARARKNKRWALVGLDTLEFRLFPRVPNPPDFAAHFASFFGLVVFCVLPRISFSLLRARSCVFRTKQVLFAAAVVLLSLPSACRHFRLYSVAICCHFLPSSLPRTLRVQHGEAERWFCPFYHC